MTAFEDFVNTELPLRTGLAALPTADRYVRFTGVGRGVEERTPAEVLSDIGAAASAHVHEGTAILSGEEGGGTKFLREDGDGTCSWQTPAGGGGGVDTSGTPVANDIARFTDIDTIEGRSYAELKADLSLEIGTDVLAQQTIGIADNNLVEIDSATVADDEYARFTANGLESRSASEVLTDLGIGSDNIVAHASVSISAGTGLTGGGNISVSRTLTLGNAIADSTDTVITGPADLDLLQYDSGSSKWVDRTLAEAGVGDVSGPTSSTDDAITTWDGVTGKLLQSSTMKISHAGSVATIEPTNSTYDVVFKQGSSGSPTMTIGQSGDTTIGDGLALDKLLPGADKMLDIGTASLQVNEIFVSTITPESRTAWALSGSETLDRTVVWGEEAGANALEDVVYTMIKDLIAAGIF